MWRGIKVVHLKHALPRGKRGPGPTLLLIMWWKENRDIKMAAGNGIMKEMPLCFKLQKLLWLALLWYSLQLLSLQCPLICLIRIGPHCFMRHHVYYYPDESWKLRDEKILSRGGYTTKPMDLKLQGPSFTLTLARPWEKPPPCTSLGHRSLYNLPK